MTQPIPPSADFIINRLPDDPRNNVFSFLILSDQASVSRAAGRAGTIVPLLEGQLKGLSVKNMQISLGNLPTKRIKTTLPDGRDLWVQLPQITPKEIVFETSFELFQKAARSKDKELALDAFEGLKRCKNLSPAEKQQIAEFVLKNPNTHIPSNEFISFLVSTGVLIAPMNHRIEASLRFVGTSASPEVLRQLLIDLSENRHDLQAYRLLRNALTAEVLDHLSEYELKKLISNLSTSPTDLENLIPLFKGEKLRYQLQTMDEEIAISLSAAVIHTKNPALLKAFCKTIRDGESYVEFQQQVTAAIRDNFIHRFSGEYLATLRTTL